MLSKDSEQGIRGRELVDKRASALPGCGEIYVLTGYRHAGTATTPELDFPFSTRCKKRCEDGSRQEWRISSSV